jgi:AcrR family transcriptional regulator
MGRRGGPPALALKKAAIVIGLRMAESHGEHALSMRAVACEMDYTVGHLIHLFGSREAFMDEVRTQAWATCYWSIVHSDMALDQRGRLEALLSTLDHRRGLIRLLCANADSVNSEYALDRISIWSLIVDGLEPAGIPDGKTARLLASIFVGVIQTGSYFDDEMIAILSTEMEGVLERAR